MEGVEQPGLVHQTRVKPDEQAVEAVVRAVATTKGCQPDELQPVQRVIDGDALNTFFEHTTTVPTVGFEYEGYAVQVTRSTVKVTNVRMA
jgi:hypothetical protein